MTIKIDRKAERTNERMKQIKKENNVVEWWQQLQSLKKIAIIRKNICMIGPDRNEWTEIFYSEHLLNVRKDQQQKDRPIRGQIINNSFSDKDCKRKSRVCLKARSLKLAFLHYDFQRS